MSTIHNEKLELPPVSSMVEIIGGKYDGHIGKVERYTPKMVEVRLFHELAKKGAMKTVNPVIMIMQSFIRLREKKIAIGHVSKDNTKADLPSVSSMVEIIGGKYEGHVGKVERYTPKMVEVRLFHELAKETAIKTLNQVVTIRKYNIQQRKDKTISEDDITGLDDMETLVALLTLVLIKRRVHK
jgi:transcription antitermination factor NusG